MVKTKISSLLNDQKILISLNYLNNSNLITILNNIQKNNKKNYLQRLYSDNGLQDTFYKLLSDDQKVYDTINIKELINLNQSNENILTYLPSLKNNFNLNEFLQKQNFDNLKNIIPGNNKITPLLSSITIKNLFFI